MTMSLERAAGACGLTYFLLLLANLAFTADGPRPDKPAAEELKRILAESDALRASALLGTAGALALAGLAIAVALIAWRAGLQSAGAAAAGAGLLTAGVWLVSFGALAAAPQSAQLGGGADVATAMGHLHSTTLLISFAPLGAFLIAAGEALRNLVPGWTRWLGLVVGVCSVIASASILSVKLDTGPLGVPLVIAFLGFPLWALCVSVPLLRHHDVARTPSAQS